MIPDDGTGAEYEALLQFMYLAPVGLIQFGNDGAIEMINPMSAQLLMPLSVDGDLTNLFTAFETVAPELRAQVAAFDATHGAICQDYRVPLTAGGGQRDAQVLALSLIRLDQTRLMALVSDVSLTVKRERLLRESESWFNAIATGVSDYALLGLDAAGRIDSWNASVQRVLGFAADALLGQSLSTLFPTGSMPAERVADALAEADTNGWSLRDSWMVKGDGGKLWGSAMIAPLREFENPTTPAAVPQAPPRGGSGHPGSGDAEPGRYALIVRDISDKREAVEMVRRAQESDHLTGLANRRAFFDAAEREIARWRRAPRALSVVMIDADHFKAVNDNYGHAGGDAVLRALAQLLQGALRDIDLVARIGGEEFALLLPSTEPAGAVAIANRVRERIAATSVDFESRAIRFTISAGVAAMSAEVEGVDDLLKRADRALYLAKASGRNRVVVHEAGVPD